MFRMSRTPDLPLRPVTGAALDRVLERAPQAEWLLAHQGAEVLLSGDRAAGWLTRRAGPHLVALGAPMGPPAPVALAATARRRLLSPLLYKCDARTAQSARERGWAVLRLGDEAVLNLRLWSMDRPACRQLRRKLRSAGAQALRIEEARDLPLGPMEDVSREWAIRHGGERGFSMGRFEAGLLRRQRVLLAWSSGSIVAFASFHAIGREWALDLMRHSSGAPDGAMHRLIAEAAVLARAEGAERLSLAAIPEPRVGRPWLDRLGLGACGLAQFKRSFGPELRPRYAAAPSRLTLATGLAAVAWAIHRPPTLDRASTNPAEMPGPRRVGVLDVAHWLARPQFRFEPRPVPCDAPPAQSRPATIPPWDATGCPGRPDL